jgi:hypothetical protein
VSFVVRVCVSTRQALAQATSAAVMQLKPAPPVQDIGKQTSLGDLIQATVRWVAQPGLGHMMDECLETLSAIVLRA